MQRVDHAFRRIGRKAQRFAGMNVARRVYNTDVGEGAADVNANTKGDRRRQVHLRALFFFDVSGTKYRVSSDLSFSRAVAGTKPERKLGNPALAPI
jgi:hypothetical protein